MFTNQSQQNVFSIALGAIATLPAATTAVGQISIAPAVSYVANSQPGGMTAGDFNGDGQVDLASLAEAPDRVLTFLNNGSGGFVAGPQFFLPASSSPQDLIAGDFNNDGIVDLAVTLRDPVGQVMILVNAGGAVFANLGSFPVGDRPRGISVGDVNANGSLDIAVANRDDDTASVLLNNGSGSFSVVTLNVGQEPRATALGDFNGNGWLDLAVTNSDSRTVSIFTNTTGTTFVLAQTLSVGAQVRPDGIVAAELNQSGHIDLAVAVSGATPVINQAMLFFNTGKGFGAPVGVNTNGINTSQINAADLDCDGLTDLVTTNQDSNNISVLRGIGAGSFAAPITMAAGTRPGEVAVADLGEYGQDIAVVNRDSNSVTVHLNQSPGCLPCGEGDVNCDGIVNANDLLIVINSWGPCPVPPQTCPADVAPHPNGDGVVNVNDLLMVINNWG